ncbi:sigma factor-like helix-turn-helix DNA-binding protein [Paenibacillus sp. IHBB 3054]|uniref:sigma factor-like helix-turn-helix DNA-binding protein n=1 Tax=Paenibacillus sp. IHBB 3054 TaxID=3425689 RepID=UPI003F67EB1B
MDNQSYAYERYRKEIYRIAWRAKYRARKIRTREFPLFDNHPSDNFAAHSVDKVWVQEIMNELPARGRTILYKIYLEDMTEIEVAKELKISQQAVSKWKRKMIQQLSQTVNL